jgi:hypothetical protein
MDLLMPWTGRMRRKGDLPSKSCAVCGRPFTWRKKWADVWDDVKYCSDACRHQRRPSAQEDQADLPPPARG